MLSSQLGIDCFRAGDAATLIKICGLSTEAAIDTAAREGASHIGLVHFEKSPRHVTLEQAAELRRRVTSPNGTTEAAIKTFQAGGFEALVEQALNAAANRSAELAEQLGK